MFRNGLIEVKERGIGMTNLIVVGILFVIIGSAVAYIVKEKKNGVKCIGCPSGCNCSAKSAGQSDGCCGCHSGTKA